MKKRKLSKEELDVVNKRLVSLKLECEDIKVQVKKLEFDLKEWIDFKARNDKRKCKHDIKQLMEMYEQGMKMVESLEEQVKDGVEVKRK